MRCSARSTTWAGRAVALLAVLAGPGVSPAAAAVTEDAVREAIVEAVRHRVGTSARIDVRDLVVRLAGDAEGSVFASLSSETKAGAAARVVLKVLKQDGRASRFGEATCVIGLSLPGLRTRRAVARGRELGADDLEAVVVEAEGWPLRALPRELEGARAVVDIAAGQVLHRSMVMPAPLVRTGDEVTVTLRRGPIEVEGRGIAAQTGQLGDVIHVMTPESKRRLAVRITGRRLVEVQHGR